MGPHAAAGQLGGSWLGPSPEGGITLSVWSANTMQRLRCRRNTLRRQCRVTPSWGGPEAAFLRAGREEQQRADDRGTKGGLQRQRGAAAAVLGLPGGAAERALCCARMRGRSHARVVQGVVALLGHVGLQVLLEDVLLHLLTAQTVHVQLANLPLYQGPAMVPRCRAIGVEPGSGEEIGGAHCMQMWPPPGRLRPILRT